MSNPVGLPDSPAELRRQNEVKDRRRAALARRRESLRDNGQKLVEALKDVLAAAAHLRIGGDGQESHQTAALAKAIARVAAIAGGVLRQHDLRRLAAVPVPLSGKYFDERLWLRERKASAIRVDPREKPRSGAGLAAGADIFRLTLDGVSHADLAARAEEWVTDLPAGPAGDVPPEDTVAGVRLYFQDLARALSELWFDKTNEISLEEEEITNGKTTTAPKEPTTSSKEGKALAQLRAKPGVFQNILDGSNVVNRLRKYGHNIESARDARAAGEQVAPDEKGWRLRA